MTEKQLSEFDNKYPNYLNSVNAIIALNVILIICIPAFIYVTIKYNKRIIIITIIIFATLFVGRLTVGVIFISNDGNKVF
jgi:hypothetical protein